ncbi:MAG: hypothetical protein JW747_03870 [Candidatus Aminicenantes bacterium]|nr:hypothetical protein [Candidatus Aminicenantes bacterium]
MKTVTVRDNKSQRGAGIGFSAIIVLLAAGMFFGAGSQRAAGQGRFFFGLHGQGGTALGEFRNHLAGGFGGFHLEFHYAPVRASHFDVGLSFGFNIYGIERYEDYFSSRNADFWIDMTTTNSMLNGLLSLRWRLGRGVLQPYVEGLVGFGIIRTETSADDNGDAWDQFRTENLSDSYGVYGAGAGVMIVVLRVQGLEGRKIMEGMIDVRGRYLKGGRAEFLLEGGIRREEGLLVYDIRESRIDAWTILAGFLLRF